MHILIVEDEKDLAGLLKGGLEEENHRVALANDGRGALKLAAEHDFDAIVLDVMLPGLDGFEVARRLRRAKNETPVLMLTARDAAQDVVRGLDVGADDYLTKPFSFEVLLARLRALVRRGVARPVSQMRVADLILDPGTHRVFRGKAEIRLTATEFRMLEFLMRRTGRAVSRQAIVEAVWGPDEEVAENNLDAFARLLRVKIDRGHRPKLLHTLRGVGYTLRAESES
jgi:DNA-binding response OmpR family regulator